MGTYNETLLSINKTETESQVFSSLAKAHLVIAMFGIIGNTICICVFFQKNLLIRKFNWYLLILSIAEFFFCCIVFANTIVYAIAPAEGRMMTDLFLIPCYINEYLVNCIDAFCVFLTLLLSIDRLKAILDPINSRLFFTNRYPKRITFTSLIIIMIIKSTEIILAQRRFINNTMQLEDNSTNCDFSEVTILPRCLMCENKNKEAFIIVCGITLPLLLNIIPTILILILNTILLIYVTNYKSKASNILTSQKKSVKQFKNIQQKSHHFTIIIMGIW
jgi:cytochrome c-type biogenesis protein CcmH/NrfF